MKPKRITGVCGEASKRLGKSSKSLEEPRQVES